MKYLIVFKYDGTKFHGFQRQNTMKSVQKTIEDALSNLLNEKVVIKGSGRTDAGVHANYQTASFDTNRKLCNKDIKNLNKTFNKEIVIFKYKLVSDDFHARFNVVKKRYVYKIYLGKNEKLDGYYYQFLKKLDINKMKSVAKILEGTHDYRNFVSGKRDDYVSTIFSIKLRKYGKYLFISFVGVGFYRYMVRHLVGAILDVGKCRVDCDVVKDMLDDISVHKNLSVVPACGLYLDKVFY